MKRLRHSFYRRDVAKYAYGRLFTLTLGLPQGVMSTPMKVLVFEDNLMWSSRLLQSLKGFGHEGLLKKGLPESGEGAQVAIVNLGSTEPNPVQLVAKLHEHGVRVIAHAGHKEKQLLELGREAGADILATNSELTFKLPELVERAIRV